MKMGIVRITNSYEFLNKKKLYPSTIRKFITIRYSHLFLSFFFFLPCSVFSQTFILEKSIPLQADFFTVDHLGNIYTIKSDQLLKFNSDYKQVNTYSSKLLGNITAIDVNNPMKIILFYKNLSQVVFLDNTLSQQGDPVALEGLGLEQATLVCSSINNGLWVYDHRNFQLVRLDQNLKTIAETGNIIQQTGGELQPDFLLERNNWVYLNDTARGILVFDIFGTYSKTIPLKNIDRFNIIEDVVFFDQDNKLYNFSTKTMEQKEIPLPETECKQVMTDGKKIFTLGENEMRVYLNNTAPQK